MKELTSLNKVIKEGNVIWVVSCGSHKDTFKTLTEALKFMNFLM